MIRFLPDTWSDALLRPIAMAAPDAGVYVEIMAPDVRFACIVVLTIVWAALAWRRQGRATPVLALLMFVSAAFVAWLATTGNGRYFLPVLLAAGPLCIGLVHKLSSTLAFRVIIASVVVAVQAFVVYQNSPAHSWRLAPWSDAPFFEVTLDEEAATQPATYVTATSISYSLIAPKFPAEARWVNISSQPDPAKTAAGRRVQALLAESKAIRLVIPTVPDYMTPQGQPNEAITTVINGLVSAQHLALQQPVRCRLLLSRGLASQAFRDAESLTPARLARFGFWVCPLEFPVQVTVAAQIAVSPEISRTFEAIERACPRLFPPGGGASARLDGGFVRDYSSADMKLYVLDDGSVFYKYWRAINPMLIGRVEAVLAESFKMDCNAIRGRSGLPWDRQL